MFLIITLYTFHLKFNIFVQLTKKIFNYIIYLQ